MEHFCLLKFSSCPLSIIPFQGGCEKQYFDINHDSLILPTLKLHQKWSHTVYTLLCLVSLAKQNVFLRFNHIVYISAFKIFSCHIILHCLNVGPYILQFSLELSPFLIQAHLLPLKFFHTTLAALLHKTILSYLGSDTYLMV